MIRFPHPAPAFRPAARALVLAVAVLPLLAACGGGRGILSQRPRAPCPRVALLADAVDLTRYRPGAVPDLNTMEVDARMTGFGARCDYAPGNAGLDVTLRVAVSAERGPAAGGRVVDLPYLVAVTEGGEDRILSRAAETLRVAFPDNQRSAAVQGEEISVRIPGDVRQASEKAILLGFRLTPEQLAANRQRGVR